MRFVMEFQIMARITVIKAPQLRIHDNHQKNSSLIYFQESISASTSNSNLVEENGDDTDNEKDDYLQSPELVNKEKHVFILSSAGKPIYSRQVFILLHVTNQRVVAEQLTRRSNNPNLKPWSWSWSLNGLPFYTL